MALIDPADPVVITGLGLVTPLGGDVPSTWDAIRRGISARRRLHELPPRPDGQQWSGCPAVPPRGPTTQSPDPVLRWGLAAAAEAWTAARLDQMLESRDRIGCFIGSSKGGLHAAAALSRGANDPGLWPAVWPSALGTAVAARWNLRGPCVSPVTACATGVVAILRGVLALRTGECDIALTGSADDSLHPGVLASYQRLGVLAAPGEAALPCDRRRTGFVVGAGAGMLVLERRSHAVSRGVPWIAEIRGAALAADPTGITQVATDGNALAHLLRIVVPSRDVPSAIQLHGTGTMQNDVAECRALRAVFGDRLDAIATTGAKGALGHLLGAAGSVETALAGLMLRDQLVPPIASSLEPDPDCNLRLVTGHELAVPLDSVLKLSLGFGGHLAALWLTPPTR